MKKDNKFSISTLEIIEKTAFVIIVLAGLLFIITGFFLNNMSQYIGYMVLMNVLLGIKVFCGLSIIFIEFTKTFGSEVEK
jgi:multicomponent Na+:H+ antiporter subunit B